MLSRIVIVTFCILAASVGQVLALSPGTDVLVPAAGLVGTWKTDLYILNPGTTTADATVELLVRGQANPMPESRNFTIEPGETVVLENVFADTFGLASFGGAVRVTANVEVVVNSRIFNDQDGVTFGQGFEGVPRCMAVQEGESTDIVGLAKSASFRTNLVLLDATGDTESTAPTRVRVTLFDEHGMQIAVRAIELDGFEPFLQRIDHSSVFGGSLADFDYGTLRCEVIRGAVVVSASKVDNDSATGDPTTLAAWTTAGCVNTPPPPEGDVYLYSSTGDDDLAVTIGEWSSGSTLTELTDDPDYGRVMMVEPGTLWGAPSSCISFQDIGDFQANYDVLVFKIKSADLTAINVKIPEVELTYPFSEAADLGNGWYEVTAPLSEFVGTVTPPPTQFGVLGGYSFGGTFYITDVQLTKEE